MGTDDFNILKGLTAPESDPWSLPEPDPTTHVALWPHPEPPTITEVCAAISQYFDEPIEPIDEVDA